MLRALGGEYVLPEAGGDLLRDGAGVLPTGIVDAAFFAPGLSMSVKPGVKTSCNLNSWLRVLLHCL